MRAPAGVAVLPAGLVAAPRKALATPRVSCRIPKRVYAAGPRSEPPGPEDGRSERQPASAAPPAATGSSQRGAGIRARPAVLGDPELVEVLELATDEELRGLYELLHGRALFSPLLKTLVAEREEPALADAGAGGAASRDLLIAKIDRRLRFLAADARATLRGAWPGYRQVLLMLRDRLGIRCPPTLLTPELEAEVFLHVLERHADAVDASAPTAGAAAAVADMGDGGAAAAREQQRRRGGGGGGLLQRLLAPLRLGQEEIAPALASLSGALAVSNLRTVLLQRLGGQLVRKEVALQAALHATKSRVAVQAAQQGFTAAASRYAAARSLLSFVGPLLWASTAIDLLLLSIGPDFSRVVQAVFALAQIRLLRTGGWTTPGGGAGA